MTTGVMVFLLVPVFSFWGLDLALALGNAALTGSRGLSVALRWYVVQCLLQLRASRAGVAQKRRIRRGGPGARNSAKILVPTEEVVRCETA